MKKTEATINGDFITFTAINRWDVSTAMLVKGVNQHLIYYYDDDSDNAYYSLITAGDFLSLEEGEIKEYEVKFVKNNHISILNIIDCFDYEEERQYKQALRRVCWHDEEDGDDQVRIEEHIPVGAEICDNCGDCEECLG